MADHLSLGVTNKRILNCLLSGKQVISRRKGENPVTINSCGMKQTWLWVLLPLAVFLAVFGFFFALFPARLLDGSMFFWPAALLAMAAGVASHTLVRGFQQSWSLSSVIVSAISVLVVLASACAVAMDLNGYQSEAMIAGMVAFTGFTVIPFFSGEHLEWSRKKTKIAEKFGPTIWADRIEAVGRRCSRPEVKTKVLRLGGETRFLSAGEESADSLINQGITRAIEELSEVIRSGDESSALSMLGNIRSLFAQRENQLRP